MLNKIEHVGILVSNMDRSVAFYTEVLGLKLRARTKVREGVELAFLQIGDSELELICKAGEEGGPKDGVVEHLTFTVTDVDCVLAHLKRCGVTLIDETPRDMSSIHCRIAFFRGPDGEKLELLAHI